MDVSKIPPGRNPPDEINAVIEIPQGGVPVKYSTRCREPCSSTGLPYQRAGVRQRALSGQGSGGARHAGSSSICRAGSSRRRIGIKLGS
jgi:hypothetical protein